MQTRFMDSEEGFELLNDNEEAVGKIVWKLEGDTMVMNGTFIDPSMRGQHGGETLLDAAANYARQNNYKMKAVCPYVIKKFRETTNYVDVEAS